MSSVSGKYIIILFEIGFGLTFNLVGSISISEIFLVLFTIKNLFCDCLVKKKEFREIVILYLLLIFFQCLSEFIVGNTLNNAFKGIAISVVSFCHFYFLVHVLSKNRNAIIYIIMGLILRRLIFGTSIDGDAESALYGEDATYLKFYIAPLIIDCLLFLSIKVNSKRIPLVFILVGVFLIVVGARSLGIMTFITGLVSYVFRCRTGITNKSLLTYAIPCLIVGYISYVIYVDNVLSGNVTSGNSEQLLIADNPYNPIYLLLAGRSEVFVGWLAFMDAPLWGHGSWARDIGYHYLSIVSAMHDKEFNIYALSTVDVIPTHSVLIGYGTFNGIIPFIILVLLMVKIFKYGFFCMRHISEYKVILVSFIIQLFWNLLFSPLSHFRQTLPLYMSFIFVLYLNNRYQTKKSIVL